MQHKFYACKHSTVQAQVWICPHPGPHPCPRQRGRHHASLHLLTRIGLPSCTTARPCAPTASTPTFAPTPRAPLAPPARPHLCPRQCGRHDAALQLDQRVGVEVLQPRVQRAGVLALEQHVVQPAGWIQQLCVGSVLKVL